MRDDFYADPDAIRRVAQSMEYREREGITGFMTDDVFHERGVRGRLEKILGARITRWDKEPELGNGIFYGGFAGGKHKEVPRVHTDEPFDDVTIVVYLTPGIPAGFGTSLWQHKSTGLLNSPTRADARRLKSTVTKLRAHLERDSGRRDRWIEVDRVGYRYNRMVAYASGMLHAATQHFGASVKGGRIYQTFRVGVDWRSAPMQK